jgi:hypothetical protein
MAKQPKRNAAIEEIKGLEDRRYSAMLAGDTVVLDELSWDDLKQRLCGRTNAEETRANLLFFGDHNTAPNILNDVFDLRPRYLLPIHVNRQQTGVAVSKNVRLSKAMPAYSSPSFWKASIANSCWWSTKRRPR